MPNWCSNDYTITGNEKDIKVLHDKFIEAGKNAKIETSFGDSWLGHVVEFLGVNYEEVPCRGWVTYIEESGDELKISTETAWGPLHDPILMMCEKYAPDAEILYTSIEPGCCIYISNDPDEYGHYLLDIWDSPEELAGIDYSYFSATELRQVLKKALHMPHLTTPKLIEEAHDRWSDCLAINMVEHVPL